MASVDYSTAGIGVRTKEAQPLFSALSRNGALDGLRLLLALGIVYFHAGAPGRSFALAALQAFVVLSIYFGLSRPLRANAKRLMVPWIFWCVVFGSLKIIDAVLTGAPVRDEFQPWMLLAGPAIHLWYLPFVLFVTLALGALPARAITPVALVVAVVSYVIFTSLDLPDPFAQWVSVMPAAAIGALLAVSRNQSSALALLMTGAAAVWFWQGQAIAMQLTLALLMICAASRISARSTAHLRTSADLCLGIYLVHPVFLTAFGRTGLDNAIALFAVAAVASLAAALVCRRLIPRFV